MTREFLIGTLMGVETQTPAGFDLRWATLVNSIFVDHHLLGRGKPPD